MSEIKITTSSEYEYRGLLANTWDLFRGDTSGWPDRAFYLELIHKHGEPVLDVGCGTGRLLLDFLGQGLDVDGVDNSPEMLALCRQKAATLGLTPNLFEQGMETMALPRRYWTIIIPSLSFQLVTDLDQARQAMCRLYDHLEPEGLLAMNFWVMWEPGDPKERDRWYTQDQAKELYLEAGFSHLKLLKTSTWEPAGEDDIHFTVLGYRS